MISRKKLLDLIVKSAEVVIPFGDLTDEQRDILLSIQYRFCDCKRCSSPYVNEKPKADALAHFNKRTYVVSISKRWFDFYLQKDFAPYIGLFIVIRTMLHEILHGLYPLLGESAIEQKTTEWLNAFDWDLEKPHFARTR